jgi:predicted small lipoprotein YifL
LVQQASRHGHEVEIGLNRQAVISASRRAALLATAGAIVLAVSACGRKGPLEPYPDDPAARTSAESNAPQSPGKFTLGNSKKTLSSPITPPDRPFILDALL